MAAAERVVVMDNGAASLKVGFAGEVAPRKEMPNCIVRGKGAKRQYVADQVESCEDIQSLTFRRPFDRGYVVSWETQKEIWDRAFYTILKVKPSECSLLVTEPPFNLPSIQSSMDEMVFEEYGFRACHVALPAVLSHRHVATSEPASTLARGGSSLVVDCGFSFTHTVPIFDGFPVSHAVRRLNLGGKALTNYLKELVSYRAWNMMEETAIIEDVKEKLCFVSLDIPGDLVLARPPGVGNPVRCEYVLPDGVKHKRGFVKDPEAASAFLKRRRLDPAADEAEPREPQADSAVQSGKPDASNREEGSAERNPRGVGPAHDSADGKPDEAADGKKGRNVVDQVLALTNERFLVPEMLFHPADLGVNQAGLADCIVESISATQKDLQPLLYSNILLTGGSTLFPGFRERLELELRPLVPDEFDVRIFTPQRPSLSAWLGGSEFAASDEFSASAITKSEYEELGSYRCRRKALHLC